MSYSANDNQNFFVVNGRSTSRVLAQPGGQCSISLGGWTAEELERHRQEREAAERLPQAESLPPLEEDTTSASSVVVATATGKENPVLLPVTQEDVCADSAATTKCDEPTSTTIAKPADTVSSNAFASASSTNSFNVITDRPTSRVTMPPGGHTSIRLW